MPAQKRKREKRLGCQLSGGLIPKAAINPMTETCKCPGRTFVARATAQGNIGPIKNPINATDTADTGTEGTNLSPSSDKNRPPIRRKHREKRYAEENCRDTLKRIATELRGKGQRLDKSCMERDSAWRENR